MPLSSSSISRPSCPSCGSVGTIQHVAEIFDDICSACGHCFETVEFYEADNAAFPSMAADALLGRITNQPGTSSGRTTVRDGSLLRPSHASSRQSWLLRDPVSIQESRHRLYLEHKPHILSLIRLILNRVGYLGALERVDALFDYARQLSLQQRDQRKTTAESLDQQPQQGVLTFSNQVRAKMIKWGSQSESIAAACCYAVLWREGKAVSIETIAAAAQQPESKVKTSFKLLKFLVGAAVKAVPLRTPRVYIPRIVDFFETEMLKRRDDQDSAFASLPTVKTSLSRLTSRRKASSSVDPIKQTQPPIFYDNVNDLALQLCDLFWPIHKGQERRTDPQICAFALVLVAIEGVTKKVVHRGHFTKLLPLALNRDGQTANGQDQHSGALNQRYNEVLLMIDQWACQMSAIIPPPKKLNKKKLNVNRTYSNEELAVFLCDIVRFKCDGRIRLTVDTPTPESNWLEAGAGGLNKQGDSDDEELETAASNLDEILKALDSRDQSNLKRQRCKSTIGEIITNETKSKQAQTTDHNLLERLDILLVAIQRLERTSSRKAASANSSYERLRPRIEHVLEQRNVETTLPQHPIDQLTDAEVDSVLFTKDEMAAMFRSDEERKLLSRMKQYTQDWVEPESQSRSAHKSRKDKLEASQLVKRTKAKGLFTGEELNQGRWKRKRLDTFDSRSEATALHELEGLEEECRELGEDESEEEQDDDDEVISTKGARRVEEEIEQVDEDGVITIVTRNNPAVIRLEQGTAEGDDWSSELDEQDEYEGVGW